MLMNYWCRYRALFWNARPWARWNVARERSFPSWQSFRRRISCTMYIVPVTIDEFNPSWDLFVISNTVGSLTIGQFFLFTTLPLLYYLSMQSFYDCLFHVQRKDRGLHIWVDKMAELKGQYRSRSCSQRSCSFADLSSLYPSSYMDLTESCDVWCVNSFIFLCTGFEVIKYCKLNIISPDVK